MNKIIRRVVRIPPGIFEADQVGQVVVPEEDWNRSSLRHRRVGAIKPVRLDGYPSRIPPNGFSECPREENFIRRRPLETGLAGHLEGRRADRTLSLIHISEPTRRTPI